jgi:hypothetical protein
MVNMAISSEQIGSVIMAQKIVEQCCTSNAVKPMRQIAELIVYMQELSTYGMSARLAWLFDKKDKHVRLWRGVQPSGQKADGGGVRLPSVLG